MPPIPPVIVQAPMGDDPPTSTLYYGADCRESLRRLPDQSVHTVCTSPPYWGLRDYGNDPSVWGGDKDCDHDFESSERGWNNRHAVAMAMGDEGTEKGGNTNHRSYRLKDSTCAKCGAWLGQLGLEPSPYEFVEHLVEIFAEVKRVLRDDGTLWLNLGDSYANPGIQSSALSSTGGFTGERMRDGKKGTMNSILRAIPEGIKYKDLVGIPWAVAKALRDPYYTGRMKKEKDRVWIAAVMDSGGCISGFTHERADGGGIRTGVNLTITNTSTSFLDECHRIWPASRHEHENHGDGHLGGKPSWRWVCHGVENKIQFLREIYPHLIAKKNQALLAYNLLVFMQNAKRMGKTPEAHDVHEKRALLTRLISEANQGDGNVSIPKWCDVPPSVFEPGWYLRADIIWAKSNPMPESVTDRPTKAHEYLFLLTKQEQYFYDADAIREDASASTTPRPDSSRRHGKTKATVNQDGGVESSGLGVNDPSAGRNKRSVWNVNTKPYRGAHFATWPEDLVEPMILAGTGAMGCCAQCGAAYKRVVEKEDADKPYEYKAVGIPGESNGRGQRTGAMGTGLPVKSVTWDMGCDCPTFGLNMSRPQSRRAVEIFIAKKLTQEHLDAIRSVGFGAEDSKRSQTQTGTGKNTDEAQKLADEAKAVLGSYYREFMSSGRQEDNEPPCDCPDAPLKRCVVLDPFSGSATTGKVANDHGRDYIGLDANTEYLDMAVARLQERAAPQATSEDSETSSVMDLFG